MPADSKDPFRLLRLRRATARRLWSSRNGLHLAGFVPAIHAPSGAQGVQGTQFRATWPARRNIAASGVASCLKRKALSHGGQFAASMVRERHAAELRA